MSDELRLFQETVRREIDLFPATSLVRRVQERSVTLHHYQELLRTLFHQTYEGPYSFARAAANCSWNHEGAKEYLLRHAMEEHAHWRWLLDDLRAIGFEGNPRDEAPHPTCLAFISLQITAAEQMPLARLAGAAVLEGIGATHGTTYGRLLISTLGLKDEQATFFLSHGHTDIAHTAELDQIIADCRLTAKEWQRMRHTAKATGQLYRAMYDHEAFA